MKRRIISIIAVIAVCISCLAVFAFAEKDSAASGMCGSGITWEYDGAGTLSINGVGDIGAWGDFSAEIAPWIDSAGNNACKNAELLFLGEEIDGLTAGVIESLPLVKSVSVIAAEQIADIESLNEELFLIIDGSDAVTVAEFLSPVKIETEEPSAESVEISSEEPAEIAEGMYLIPAYYDGTHFMLYSGTDGGNNLKAEDFSVIMKTENETESDSAVSEEPADENADTEALPEEELPAPAVKVSSCSVKPGKEIHVTVSLENNAGAANIGLQLTYDAEVLTLVSAANAVKDMTYVSSDVNADGPFVTQWFKGSNSTFNGDLVTLRFKVNAEAETGDYGITVDPYLGKDGKGVDGETVNFTADFSSINLRYESGTVTVTDHTPGDINGDSAVNNNDYNLLIKYLMDNNTKVNEEALDVDGNGSVDNRDAVLLSQYIADKTISIH